MKGTYEPTNERTIKPNQQLKVRRTEKKKAKRAKLGYLACTPYVDMNIRRLELSGVCTLFYTCIPLYLPRPIKVLIHITCTFCSAASQVRSLNPNSSNQPTNYHHLHPLTKFTQHLFICQQWENTIYGEREATTWW